MSYNTMHNPGLHEPRQSRSQQTLERILSSSTALIAEQSYDQVTIAEIAEHARISVGGFYSRFQNKEALLGVLMERLAQETQERISAAHAGNWSNHGLQDLLLHIVSNNAKLYEKYRGVLTVIHLQSRILQPDGDNSKRDAYNKNIVAQLESLILLKREQIGHRRPGMAIRTAIVCMTSMLRDAIVFRDTSLYPKPGDTRTVTRHVTQVMYIYLSGSPQ